MKTWITIRNAAVLIIALILLSVTNGFTADVMLTPSLTLLGGYDDNILFDRTDELEDYYSIISPALELDYNTERGFLKGLAVVDVINYLEEDQLNTTNQNYNLEGDYRLTERFGVYAEGRYTLDTTLESELEETGRVTFRQDRERFDISPGIFYNLSELSKISLDYRYTDVDYELDESVDYTINTVRLRYDRRLSNGIDTISLRPMYTHNDSDTSERQQYRIDAGWTRELTEIYRLIVFLGYRYTEQDFKDDRDNQTDNGGVVDIQFQRSGERSNLTVGYNRNLSLTVAGGLVEVDRFRARIYYRLLERFGIGFAGQLYFTRNVDEDVNEDSRYFSVEPWLQYNLTENHSIRLNYSYSEEYDDALDSDKTAARNQVWAVLDFRFPQKW